MPSREAAMEISQTRSVWSEVKNDFRRGATAEGGRVFRRPFRTDFVACELPATLWLANFQLSLPGRIKREHREK
jgi:hypothetical protein